MIDMKIKEYKEMKDVNLPAKSLYIIYARKSSESEDRQMESIPAQLSILKTIASDKELKVIKTFKESKSAKKPGRPEFNKVIAMIDENPQIKGIIAWKLNRLFRNPEDEGKIRQRLSDGRIEEIVTPNKTYEEPDSDFIMAVEGAQAQRFIRDLREDTQRGIDHKIEMGFAPGLAPVGYVNNIWKRQGEKDISPDPKYFPLMRKLFELALTGKYSLKDLTIEAKNMGIKNNRNSKFIAKSQMSRIVRNPFYTGKFLYRGKIYPGKHQAMLTDDEFDLLQDIVGGRSRPRKQIHNFWFTGIPIRCGECSCQVTGEYKAKHYKNGKSQVFIYGRCTKKSEHKCTQAYIPESELKKQVFEVLGTIRISPKFVDWASKWLKTANESQKDIREAKYDALRASYEVSIKKIDRLLDLKLSGMVSDEEFNHKKDELTAEKNNSHSQLAKINTHIDEWTDLTAKTFDFAATAQERFEKGSVSERKTILKAIGSNLTLKDKKLIFEARTPFFKIQEKLAEINSKEWLEPTNKADIVANKAYSDHQNIIWGGRADSNRQPLPPQGSALTG